MLQAFVRVIFVVIAMLPAIAAAQPVTLKLSFFTSDRSNIYRMSVKPFVDAVNAEGGNLIKVEVYFGGAISGVQADQARLVSDGTADMAIIVPGYTPDRFPDTAVMQLPGLFRDAGELSRIYTRLVEAGALRGYQDYFVVGAFVSASETLHSRKPIAALADLKGQTIRVNNPIEANALRKFGATPVLLPINETLDALSQGKIDGAAIPPAMLFEFGIGRVTSNHYMLPVGGAPTALVMNRKKFESLPPAAQAIIRKYSGDWLSDRSAASFAVKNQEVLAELEKDPRRKVVMPSKEDLATSQRVFDTVIDDWAAQSQGNRELLARSRAEIAKLRKAD